MKKKIRLIDGGRFKNFMRSIWLFPALATAVLIILTILQINGSSIGIYYKDLYGPTAQDSNLIFGSPRHIRSDEWENITNKTAAQEAAGYPRINQNIGDGQNMEVIEDVPYKSWTIVFKPQNWSFFVLPFSYAFAFKWWLLAYLLVISCYFFVLTLLPNKNLAAMISLGLLFSPFIQWWYQTATLAPIFYSFFIAITVIKMWQSQNQGNRIFWALLTAYLLTCFAIVQYPPFQIPCAIVLAIFLTGYFIENRYYKRPQLAKTTLPVILALIIALAAIGGFVAVNKQPIDAARNSVYPGERIERSGYYDSQVFLSNFLNSQLQLTRKAKNYVANQSEASNFILLSPFLTIPIIYLLARQYRKTKGIDWPLTLTTTLFLVLLIRLFVPKTEFIFKPLLFDFVPHNRLLIGIGLVSILQMLLLIRHLSKNRSVKTRRVALTAGIFTLLFNLYIGWTIRQEFPGYINNLLIIFVLSLMIALIVYLLLVNRFALSVGLLLLFSFFSAGAVHPIYRGVGPIFNSNLTEYIAKVNEANPARWAVVDNLIYEHLPLLANAKSLTATYTYPQTEYWSQAPEIAREDSVYNRFAHTIVKFPENGEPASLVLLQPDFFRIDASPCSQLFDDLGVRYFVAEKNYSKSFPCLNLMKTVVYPNKNFYILERV